MSSAEVVKFHVQKIYGFSLGSDGVKRYAILGGPKKTRVFVSVDTLDPNVGEICIGSRLALEIDDEGVVTRVNRIAKRAPQVKP